MNDLVTTTTLGSSLTADAFTQGDAQFGAAAPKAKSGGTLLKLRKQDGAWVYGAENIEVEEDSRWAVLPETLMQGFIAWHSGSVEGEQMAVFGQTPIDPRGLGPVNAKNGWEPQVGFGLQCLSGEDADTKVVYKTNTQGGVEAWNKVYDAIKTRAAAGMSLIPIVELKETNYKHSEYGTIYKPVFEIVGWHGDEQVVEAIAEPVAEETAPRRRARK